ncbi:hypothetical protein OZX60_03175 [Streptococcaceae bacterium ESL0687]|nr:hypothetical protein OZX60_03175 [Streptococcaceae bacterium ESL0687]
MEKKHEFEAPDAREVETAKRKEERLEKQSKFVLNSKEEREHKAQGDRK